MEGSGMCVESGRGMMAMEGVLVLCEAYMCPRSRTPCLAVGQRTCLATV